MDGGSPITIQHEQKCILHVVCDSADAVLDCCGFTCTVYVLVFCFS